MKTISDRAKERRNALGLTQKQVGARAGVSQGAIGNLESGLREAPRKLLQIAAALGVEPEWLESGKGPMLKSAADAQLHSIEGQGFPGEPELAHQLSHLEYETVSPMSWEQLMSEDQKGTLPKKFSFPMPDESMAPRVRQGAVIVMDSMLEAKVGDGVLVRDSSGTLHFRQYRAGRPGVWEAYAFNETYRALESDRDGLTVLAVKVALEDRGL